MSLCRSLSAASSFPASLRSFSPRRPLGHSLRPGSPLRLRRLLLLPLCKAQYFACLRAIASEASPEVLSEAIQKSQRAVCFLHHARRPEFGFTPFLPLRLRLQILDACGAPMPCILAAAYVYNTLMPTANHVVQRQLPVLSSFVFIVSTTPSIYCPFGPSSWPVFPPISMFCRRQPFRRFYADCSWRVHVSLQDDAYRRDARRSPPFYRRPSCCIRDPVHVSTAHLPRDAPDLQVLASLPGVSRYSQQDSVFAAHRRRTRRRKKKKLQVEALPRRLSPH
jgi:hypothetical protein